jgi:flagellar hook-associated protein 1 FlgK
MSSLLASLASSGDSLEVYQRALGVIQNNIDNASTPGYAKQRLTLVAQPLDIVGGLAGGVASRGLADSRDQFADEEVRRHMQVLGQYNAQSQGTSAIQNFFDVTGSNGLPAALSNLFQAFSAWSVTPNDGAARQTVLDRASILADSVRGLSESLASTSQRLDGRIGSTVQQINALASKVQDYNTQRLRSTEPDPGADALLHSNLESLAELTNITTVTQNDGTVTVLTDGGSPLVVGDHQYSLSSTIAVTSPPPPANPQSPPSAHVLDWKGADVTSTISSGQLGGLLDVRNRVLGSILGDAQQTGTLNQFAKGLADTVNQVLQSANGTPLFTYNSSDATLTAGSLTLNSAITAGQLVAADSSGNANGNAIKLASLANATGNQGTINGLSFSNFLGQITSQAGQEAKSAADNLQSQQQIAAQARVLRDHISGVSLDEEAVHLIEFQRGYQASARVLSVLSDLTATTINMIQQ